ncbi:uncharacterized protein LOC133779384 [Humulus lupulus]|uniref:uncharacterized protein LOC133779384 n=1 Tax=Humulus lupulus TaxID=3486 RepID=UPI002B40D7CA|nr:uncharacterized protein LOC133779384 [Humulus lupulus]
MENHFPNWDYHTSSIIEGRILVMWRRLFVKTIILEESSQAVHCQVKMLGLQQEFGVTFVYGLNSIKGRRCLWEGLQRPYHIPNAWIYLGDFNAPLSGKDRAGGKAVSDSELHDSLNWLAGAQWLDLFSQSTAIYRWEGISDHCSCLVSIQNSEKLGSKLFRYYNYWAEHKDFNELVLKSWRGPITAYGMNAIFLKLLRLKHCLNFFNKDRIGDLQANYHKAKDAYQVAQLQAQAHPLDSCYQDAERTTAGEFSVQERLYQSFLIQRSKVTWLRQGDLNTSFFHAFLKKRKAENGIVSFMTEEGQLVDNYTEVVSHFLGHFKDCLGSPSSASGRVNMQHIDLGPKLSVEQQASFLRPFSKKEIREALFSIPNTKSPGPDGYGSDFFKAVWSKIGEEVCSAISYYFESGNFPSKLRETTISLIPKIANPSRAVDYRLIACCSTLYKCMAKLICKRLAVVLPVIVQSNQGAFIQG